MQKVEAEAGSLGDLLSVHLLSSISEACYMSDLVPGTYVLALVKFKHALSLGNIGVHTPFYVTP